MAAVTHKASCVCGAVQMETVGSPIFSGYCHCNECRHSLVNEKPFVTAFESKNVKITSGADKITHYKMGQASDRGFCSLCGTRLFNYVEPKSMQIVYPSLFEFARSGELDSGELPPDWKPQAHIVCT